MAAMKPKDVERCNKLFEDAEGCFGKLYDPKEADCTKCKDVAFCIIYVEKGKKAEDEATGPAEGSTEAADTQLAEVPVTKKGGKVAPKKASATKPDAKAKEAKKGEGKKPNLPAREKDENGFTVGSKGGKIYAMLKAGKSTKEQILAELDKEYPGANNKTTMNTFMGDLQRPVGTYSASRGVTIKVAEKTNIASIVAAAKK